MVHIHKGKKPKNKSDWREVILTSYHKKCAYCEQKEEAMQIEHYRPQSLYGWLSDSWDNLLLSCTKCNINKSDNFPIDGTKITTFSNPEDFDNIEQPKLINPEKETNPEKNFVFKPTGEISGNTLRGSKTVSICKLDRNYLNEKRKTIFDEVKYSIRESSILNNTEEIKKIINSFIDRCKKPETEFLAFHLHILKNELKAMYRVAK